MTEYAKEATRLVVEDGWSLARAIDYLLRGERDKGRKVYLKNEIERRSKKMIARRQKQVSSTKHRESTSFSQNQRIIEQARKFELRHR